MQRTGGDEAHAEAAARDSTRVPAASSVSIASVASGAAARPRAPVPCRYAVQLQSPSCSDDDADQREGHDAIHVRPGSAGRACGAAPANPRRDLSQREAASLAVRRGARGWRDGRGRIRGAAARRERATRLDRGGGGCCRRRRHRVASRSPVSLRAARMRAEERAGSRRPPARRGRSSGATAARLRARDRTRTPADRAGRCSPARARARKRLTRRSSSEWKEMPASTPPSRSRLQASGSARSSCSSSSLTAMRSAWKERLAGARRRTAPARGSPR